MTSTQNMSPRNPLHAWNSPAGTDLNSDPHFQAHQNRRRTNTSDKSGEGIRTGQFTRAASVTRAVTSLIFIFLAFTVLASHAQKPASSRAASAQSARLASNYGNLPLMFEPNQGQGDPQARFLSHGSGYSVSLTAGGMVLAVRPSEGTSSPIASSSMQKGDLGSARRQQQRILHERKSTILTINLVGAAANPVTVGEEPLTTKVNYFIGRDPSKWHRNIPTYGKIRYRNVYPGIDLVYYGHNHSVEYDFDLAPGADATQIQFSVKGSDALSVDPRGNLLLTKGSAKLLFQTPVIYQERNGSRIPVAGSYTLRDATHVGFELGKYDNSKPLVIDPVLVYSSFLGGSSDDFSNGIAVDSAGDAYVVGVTDSPDFPLATIGTYSPTQFRMFLTKFNSTGSSLIFADYFGGTNGSDAAYAVALDSSGNAYVTGVATSSDFPVLNAYQSTLAGTQDAFLTKFLADGSSIVYSTYLGGAALTTIGGSTSQYGNSVSVDSLNQAVIAGVTAATDFPTRNAYQSSVAQDQFGDWGEYGFVTKFASDGLSLIFSSYLGGSTLNTASCSGCFPYSEIFGVASDGSGNSYVTGITTTTDFPVASGAFTTYPGSNLSDVGFVSKFIDTGGLDYSTYLGGATSSFLNAIAVDSSGSAYVTGYDSADDAFPIVSTSICDPSVSACTGAIIAKLAPTGATLTYSTYLGTSNNMAGQAIQVDASGNAFIVGSDVQFDLANPIETYAGNGDVVVAEINPSATTLLMSTFLGGQGLEAASGLALDSTGAVYVTGLTQSADFPVTQGAYQKTWAGQSDVFVAKIDPTTNAAAVSMTPLALDFGSLDVGVTSAAQTTILRNMGSAALNISGKATSGDFAETDDCGATVAPASFCTFTVTFTPTTTGLQTAALTITDNASGSPHSVTLTGTGTTPPPFVVISPSGLNFPASPVGAPATPQNLTLTNNGNVAVGISGIQVSSDFTASPHNCDFLAANASCTVTVTFNPTSAGSHTGSLQLVESGTGTTQVVNLAGSGVDFVATTTNNTSTVNAGGTASYQLNVGPVGGTFSNSVKFFCNGLPASVSCSVTPDSMPSVSSSSAVTVTVRTAGALAQLPASTGTSRRYLGSWVIGPIGIFGMLLMGTTRRRKSRTLAAGAMVVMLMILIGCSGTQKPAPSATPSGTYNFNVIAQSGALQHVTQLTLVVRSGQ